jgi:Spy/CpxP family protein refolding chaperone
MGRPFHGLNLSEAQKASMKAVAEKHKATMETKRSAAHEAMTTFHKAMGDAATSEADLQALHDKASQAQFAMMLEHRAMMKESEALLTPEQKAQWDKLCKEREEKGFGPGMERGKGMKHHPKPGMGVAPDGPAHPEKP